MSAETKSDICSISNTPNPCVIVIMGASGDLTTRKIMPSLFQLFLKGNLPYPCPIVGCARTRFGNDDFRERMRGACVHINGANETAFQKFSESLHYLSLEYGDPKCYKDLGALIQRLDKENRACGNRLFYLAVPPSLYEICAEMLGKAGLSTERKTESGWARIVVEKPFGHDLVTARKLDQTLHMYFKEHQVFRIDHYLAKETVQNILTFRFANAVFEPLWNRNYIDHVHILAAENMGVGHRAGYYEQAGVLRDMFQNHMMQLLALTAMEPPSRFEADRVRDEKVKIYRALRPFPVENLEEYLVLGQYGAGTAQGEKVPAYCDEAGVSSDSLTPTFAMLKVFLDNWRWKGVPFFLTSGKRMAKKRTEIYIRFKDVPHSMFRQTFDENIAANKLRMGIYPEEKILLTFQTKDPGPRMCMRSVYMVFNYSQAYSGPPGDAYEKVLLDCILGDRTLFWRQDGVELCWSFLTPVLTSCESCTNRAERLFSYKAGTWGPRAFEELKTIFDAVL